MKIKVMVTIEAPDGTSHYTGDLLDDPTWWKTRPIVGVPYWLYYNEDRKEWMIGSESKPHWIQEIVSL
jgi:hypothetical protein